METEPNQNPPMKTCCQCQHFQPPGECYRYPPTVFASGFTRYPRVDVNQRACGEFRLPRPEPPPAETIKEELDKMRAAVQPVIEKFSASIGPDFVKGFYAEVDKARKAAK